MTEGLALAVVLALGAVHLVSGIMLILLFGAACWYVGRELWKHGGD